jgi:hypothetical protein
MTPVSADLERLLPHRPPMVLVDGVERWDASECIARWTVPAVSLWVEQGLVLRAALVEIAAQTAALHAGLVGGATRHGYLGMVSDFAIHRDARTGDVLRSLVRRSAKFGLLTRVECRIERVGDGAATLIAEGVLTVAEAPAPSG